MPSSYALAGMAPLARRESAASRQPTAQVELRSLSTQPTPSHSPSCATSVLSLGQFSAHTTPARLIAAPEPSTCADLAPPELVSCAGAQGGWGGTVRWSAVPRAAWVEQPLCGWQRHAPAGTLACAPQCITTRGRRRCAAPSPPILRGVPSRGETARSLALPEGWTDPCVLTNSQLPLPNHRALESPNVVVRPHAPRSTQIRTELGVSQLLGLSHFLFCPFPPSLPRLASRSPPLHLGALEFRDPPPPPPPSSPLLTLPSPNPTFI